MEQEKAPIQPTDVKRTEPQPMTAEGKFDRKAYQREYMRLWRARQRKEREGGKS